MGWRSTPHPTPKNSGRRPSSLDVSDTRGSGVCVCSPSQHYRRFSPPLICAINALKCLLRILSSGVGRVRRSSPSPAWPPCPCQPGTLCPGTVHQDRKVKATSFLGPQRTRPWLHPMQRFQRGAGTRLPPGDPSSTSGVIRTHSRLFFQGILPRD